MADEIDSNEARLLQAMSVDDTPKPAEEYIARAGAPLSDGEEPAKMYDIIEAIKTVSDPEIMINVYDLGLIYKVNQVGNGDLNIEMTLTLRLVRWRKFCRSKWLMPPRPSKVLARLRLKLFGNRHGRLNV